ncbi:MAG: hypothetical protein IJ840_04410 [Bacteroidales bacterium]|nr:hypothetical protein [Bacteroidales bacterium]
MKKIMLYLILAAVAICSAAVFAHAVINRTDDAAAIVRGADDQGHVLTSLWKNYYAAEKADLPKKMSESLDAIIGRAKAKRYHWDFYDAATKKVDAEVSRNWKARGEMNTALAKEIKEYDEPIVTFAYMSSRFSGSQIDYALANKTRLQAGRNTAFYTRTQGQMNGLLNGFIKDDYEYTLWAERVNNRSSKASDALSEYLGNTYPNAAWNEYYSLTGRYWQYRRADVKAFVDKYNGKAVGLFGKSMLFDDTMSSYSRDKAGEDQYKALYAEIKAAEKERSTYKSGVEGKIAGSVTDFNNQIKSLERQEITLSFDDNDLLVILRNLPSVEVTVTPDVKGGTPFFKQDVNNPARRFFVPDTVRVRIPRCDDGNYIVRARNGKIEAECAFIPKTLSIALREDSLGHGFYVADYLTGRPIEKVDLKLSLSGKTVAEASGVEVDGFTPLPESLAKNLKNDVYYYLEASYRDTDGFLHKSKEQSVRNTPDYYSSIREREESRCEIFTDKTAFNPGETVKVTAILYKGNPYKSFSVVGAGEPLTAGLVNAEGKEVDQKELKTNEFGSVSGEFKIPEGERNGTFTLEIRKGTGRMASKSLVVDEFVLPTYDLAFDKVEKLYFAGDEIEVSGKVSSYSGHPLDAARVYYHVESWGSRVAEGEVRLASGGAFLVRFPTVRDMYWYRVTIEVVDATGETSEFSRGVYVLNNYNISGELENASHGEVALAGGKYGDCSILSGSVARVSLVAVNTDGQMVTVPVTYDLVNSGDKVVASGKAASGETVEVSVPAPGLYTLKMRSEVKATDGRLISSRGELAFVMIGDADSVLDANIENMFKLVGPCADGTVHDGEAVTVQIGAGDGPVWAVAELFGDQRQPLGRHLVSLKGKSGEAGSVETISFGFEPASPDAVNLYIFYFRNGRHYTFHREFQREKTVLDLPLSFSSFEDKACPGKQYSFTLKSQPGTEMVAAIFDKSSERISPNLWETVRLRNLGARPVFFNVMDGSVERGYGFGDIVDRKLMKTRAAGAVAENALAMAPMMEERMVADDSVTKDPEASLDDVNVRSDYSTSLVFEPHLKTGSDGSATLKFRTSDKLSTFVVQVYAHNREMRNAILRQEMVVSIPVKVNVVQPGYLHKGDKYVLHATVSSSSDRPVSGTVALQSYAGSDYASSKPFSTLSKKVTVPAGKTVPVEFAVDPEGNDVLGLKVVFADNGKTFSDAMFVSVPVYDAEQTLTEAHSAVLLAGMDKNSLVQRLRSSFTGTRSAGAEYKEIDIRQMLLDAIPTKLEPSGRDILSLTETFYLRRVAEKLEAGIDYVMSDSDILDKILSCQNADGGFGWFEGMKSSPVITAVVLERLAKIRDTGLDDGGIAFGKAVAFLDKNQFVHGDWPYWSGWLSAAQYAHVRSMFPSVPFDVSKETLSEASEFSKNFKEFKKYIKDYLIPSEKDGRGLQGQILAKARRIKTLVNLVYGDGGIALASAWGIRLSADSKMRSSIVADVASLDEYAVEHRDGGWYYPNAVMPWRGLLESELYAHSLLCDLLSDSRIQSAERTGIQSSIPGSGGSPETVIADGIRIWIMLQKETQKWGDDPAFVDAINSVLTGGEEILSTRVILMTKTYRVPFSKIEAAGNGFTIQRRFFKEVNGEGTDVNLLEVFPGMKLKRGDKIITEYRIWNQENRSFVKLTAPREAAFRPVDQLSGHVGWWYRPIGSYAVSPQGYRNVKTDRTEYYFDVYPEENTTVTEEFFITQEGTFTAPVVTIESLYAPHYRANDKFGGTLVVAE